MRLENPGGQRIWEAGESGRLESPRGTGRGVWAVVGLENLGGWSIEGARASGRCREACEQFYW